MNRRSGRVLVGVIGAPHGVRGELRLKSFTETPLAIGRYGPLSSEDGRTHFGIVALRALKDDMTVARFEGITTREAAAALTNTRLFIERAQLPEPAEEEFYNADLIGLQAVTAAGQAVGEVVAVDNFGAGDLLEIRPASGDTLLVAFTKAFVPRVDLLAGHLVLSPEALAAADPGDEAPEGATDRDDGAP